MKKKIAKLLVFCMVTQVIPMNTIVNAKPQDENEIQQATESIDQVMSDNLTMVEAENGLTKADRKDTDGDGLVDYWEESVHTDKTKADTDGDGLTDYQEGVLAIMDFPGALCENIVELKEQETTRGGYYSDYSHIVQGKKMK